jgi:hypothetical protein
MRHRAHAHALLAVLAAAPLAGASERLEIAGYAGYTFPFYSQTFRYDPGQVTVPIPGVSVEQSGQFEARASGGPAFAGGITLYATGGLGFEFRYDRADITVDTQGASYAVRVGLPAPLDPVVANLNLTEGQVDLQAVAPLSFNLKLRTGGPVRFTTSFGASRLGAHEMTLTQAIGLGVIGFDMPETASRSGPASGRPRLGDRARGGNPGLGPDRSASTPPSWSRRAGSISRSARSSGSPCSIARSRRSSRPCSTASWSGWTP